MRSSAIVTLLFAGLAIASPLKHAVKKAYVYDYVTDVVFVTVTDVVEESSTIAPAVSTVALAADYNNHGLGGGAPHLPHQKISSSVPVSPASTVESVVVVTSAPTVDTVIVTLQPSTVEIPTTTPVAIIPTTSAVAVPIPTPVAVVPVVSAVSIAPLSTAPAAAAAGTLDAADASSTDPIVASLYHHNVHRTNHSAPAVTWNDTLASYAATVASSCVYAHNLGPGGGGYGQNIAVYGETGDAQSLGQAHEIAQASTDMWYNGEVDSFLPSYYGLDNPSFADFDSWGHFSQMVWKSTEEVGCSSVYCAAGTIFDTFGSWFTVCNYGPEGNMGGEYGANVLEPLGQPSVSVGV